MTRDGIPEESVKIIKKAHRLTYRKGLKLNSVLIELEKMHSKKNDIYLKNYIKSLKDSKRGILR